MTFGPVPHQRAIESSIDQLLVLKLYDVCFKQFIQDLGLVSCRNSPKKKKTGKLDSKLLRICFPFLREGLRGYKIARKEKDVHTSHI